MNVGGTTLQPLRARFRRSSEFIDGVLSRCGAHVVAFVDLTVDLEKSEEVCWSREPWKFDIIAGPATKDIPFKRDRVAFKVESD